jgi:hypothetical protein
MFHYNVYKNISPETSQGEVSSLTYKHFNLFEESTKVITLRNKIDTKINFIANYSYINFINEINYN